MAGVGRLYAFVAFADRAPTANAANRPEADERRVAELATVSEDTAAIRRPPVPSVQPRPVALPRNKPQQWDADPLSSFGSAREQSQFLPVRDPRISASLVQLRVRPNSSHRALHSSLAASGTRAQSRSSRASQRSALRCEPYCITVIILYYDRNSM